MKSEANKVFGGYIHIKWESCAAYRRDSDGFIFSVSNKSKLTPTNPDKAIYFLSDGTLGFGGDSIECHCDPLNKQGQGRCHTNGQGSFNHYNVGTDSEGNNILTGTGKGQKDEAKRFTCTAIETY
jgi:hypothetical protein